MNRIYLFALFFLFFLSGHCQEIIKGFNTDRDSTQKEVFTMVDTPPFFPGGDDARIQFLSENINYPDSARIKGIEGTVLATFVVERDGTLSDVKILKGIGGGCDEEVLRVIKAMPRWNPGIQRGKPVRVQFNMPLKFSLSDNDKKKGRRK